MSSKEKDGKRKRRGAPQIYPWEIWADGKAHHLRYSIDYFARTPNMRGQIYKWAKDHGYQASVQSHENGGLRVRMWKEFQDG